MIDALSTPSLSVDEGVHPRVLRRLDREALLDLLATVFKSETSHAHEANYPLVLDPENLHRAHVIYEGDRIASAAIGWPFESRLGAEPIRIGVIGNVATRLEARGRGHASKVIQACERALKEEGCAMACLWSGHASFYKRLGYDVAGCEIQFFEGEDPISEPEEGWSFRSVLDVDERVSLYKRFTSSRENGGTFDEVSLRRLLLIPKMEFFSVSKDKGDEGFAMLGRGIDLEGAVHDWGGNATALAELIVYLFHRHKDAGDKEFRVLAPESAVLLRLGLSRRGFHTHRSPLGFFKVLDPSQLWRPLKRAVRRRRREPVDVKVSENGLLLDQIGIPFGRLPSFFLGAGGLSRVHEGLSKTFSRPVESWLPLPFYVWGLESC